MAFRTQELVNTLTEQILLDPAICEGLDVPYSPNHGSQTTAEHIRKQLEMLGHLCRGDYEALYNMVENREVPEFLQFSCGELRGLLEPLVQNFSDSDWKTLTIVAGYHDIGKVQADWACERGWNLEGVDWVAHDYDSKIILQNNPHLLEGYGLPEEGLSLVLELCKLHSLPGQFFFGEGNISAYEPIRHALGLARVHGLLDVMSALNHRLVKPILASHARLGQLLEFAEEKGLGLHQAFQELAESESGNEDSVAPLARKRLALLLGDKVEAEELEESLGQLEPALVKTLESGTSEAETWYGTYVANALGSGLLRALGESSREERMEVVKLLVKVASAAISQSGGGSWALSALKPSLYVGRGRKEALQVLSCLRGKESLEQVRQALREGSVLGLRVAPSGIEVELNEALYRGPRDSQ